MQTSRRTYLIVFVAALVVAFLGRLLFYYPGIARIPSNAVRLGWYQAPHVPESTPVSVESLSGEGAVALIPGSAGRIVLVDQAHNNGFDIGELADFAGNLASSGANVVYVESESDLIAGLSQADALLIISPTKSYDSEAQRALEAFVAKGGRLVIAGDPTRESDVQSLNSLAGSFGVIYQDAYIYNLQQNDGGFRNVLFTEFGGESQITKGLGEVVFQTAYALSVDGENAVILGDDNTYSSRDETPGGVVAAALTGDGKVLTLPDFTFFTSPYNTFADNPTLLSNIGSFLLSSERTFTLTDFPYFFNGPTAVVYQNPVTLNENFADSVDLRARLEEVGAPSSLAEEPSTDGAYIYIASYADVSNSITRVLKANGITLSDDPLSEDQSVSDSEGTIEVADVARLERGGTVLIHLAQPDPESTDPYRLIVLGEDAETLAAGVERLLQDDLGGCLITATTAVCHDGTTTTPKPSGGSGEASPTVTFLIVNDDSALEGPVVQTSAEAISGILDDLKVENQIVTISDDGVPDLETLQEYDAVFWSIGDYCCEAPSEEATTVLNDYVAAGGRLLIDGVFIATDWADSDFLQATLGATLAGFGPQVDIEPGDSHPLNTGFDGTIAFASSDVPLQPDIIEPAGDSVVVFVRGPESDGPGEASLVAHEDGDARVAFSSFPLFLLEDTDLAQLIENAVDWFSGK